jgi:hypothetical protein
VCAGSTLLLAKQSLDEAPYKLSGAVVKLASITFSRLSLLSKIDIPWFLNWGKILQLYSSHLPLGVPNGLVINHASSSFSGAVAGEEVEDFCEGSFSHTHPLLCYWFALLYLFLPASFFIKNPKKIRILGSCFYLSAFSFAERANPKNTKMCDFISTNNDGTEIPIPTKLLGLYEAFENNFNWICPENLFSDLSEPKHDHKGSSKTYVDEIQCLIDKTSAVDLNASSRNT